MNSNQLIDRARLLLEQQRYELAEDVLRQALSQDPDSGIVHSLLAFSLKKRTKNHGFKLSGLTRHFLKFNRLAECHDARFES